MKFQVMGLFCAVALFFFFPTQAMKLFKKQKPVGTFSYPKKPVLYNYTKLKQVQPSDIPGKEIPEFHEILYKKKCVQCTEKSNWSIFFGVLKKFCEFDEEYFKRIFSD